MTERALVPRGLSAHRPAWVGFAALLVFTAIAIAMVTGATVGPDRAGLRWMHAHAIPALDAPAWWLARAGYGWGVLPFDALLVVVLLVMRRGRDAGFAALALGGGLLLNKALKLAFARPRPVLDWPAAEIQTTFSFPSGHAMATATLATVLTALAWRSRWRWPVALAAWGFALLVAASRVLLGVHFPSDVVAGAAIGIAWGSAVWWAVADRRGMVPG